MNRPGRGISLYFGQIILFALDTIFIHRIGSGATVMQLALIRNIGLLVVAFAMFGTLSLRIFSTSMLRLQLVRSFVSVITMWLVVYSFAHLPLSEATAISYTQAIFLTLLSALLLSEKVALIRWASIFVGFAGTIVMIRPVFATFEWAYVVALLAAACNALVLVISKPLQKADSPITVITYVAVIGILFNIPGLFLSPLPNLELWPWMLGMLICGPIGQLCGILAVGQTDISRLSPWLYLRFIIASVFGGAVFYETLDSLTLIAGTVVFISCSLTLSKPKHAVASLSCEKL
jgi:drug/metabolite transporter (DMT)-like permease